MNFNELEILFKDLGFLDTEARVLVHLCQHHVSTAGLISKRTQLKRPTTYSALTSLVQKGFVSKIIKSRKSLFTLTDPQNFQNIIMRLEHARVEKSQVAIATVRVHLDKAFSIQPQHLGEFEVSVLDHNPVFSLQFSALTSGNFDAIFDPAIVASSLEGQKVCKQFLLSTAKSKPKIRELVPPGKWAKWYVDMIKNPHHEVRLLPQDLPTPSDIILMGQEVCILNYLTPVQGLRIKQPALFQSLSTWFEALWRSSKKTTPSK